MVLAGAAWIRTAQPVWLWACGLAVLAAIPAFDRAWRGGREMLFLAAAVLLVGDGMRTRFERVRREADWAGWSQRAAAEA